MSAVLLGLLWLLTLAVAAVTVLPLSGSAQWWVRVWEFPRLHAFAIAIFGAGLGLLFARNVHLIAPLVLLTCAVFQGYRIFPFTPLASIELPISKARADEAPVSVMAANVLMESTEHDRVRQLIADGRPDVLLLMETDATWQAALQSVLDEFPTVQSHPLDNHYGLIFATRLQSHGIEIVHLDDADTPTVLAELADAHGRRFYFIGLQPRPPVPGQDTEARDEQIERAATLAKDSGLPVVAMGDFNAAAWSWMALRFKQHGQFLDPRVGRGPLSSFDANSRLMRFPIDQLYVSDRVGLVSFGRADHIGSDHFPMKAEIIIEP